MTTQPTQPARSAQPGDKLRRVATAHPWPIEQGTPLDRLRTWTRLALAVAREHARRDEVDDALSEATPTPAGTHFATPGAAEGLFATPEPCPWVPAVAVAGVVITPEGSPALVVTIDHDRLPDHQPQQPGETQQPEQAGRHRPQSRHRTGASRHRDGCLSGPRPTRAHIGHNGPTVARHGLILAAALVARGTAHDDAIACACWLDAMWDALNIDANGEPDRMAYPCEECHAEPAEPCRWPCTSHDAHDPGPTTPDNGPDDPDDDNRAA